MTPLDVKKILENPDKLDIMSHIFQIQEAFADLAFETNDVRDREGGTLTCQKVAIEAKELKHGPNELMVPWVRNMITCIRDECREAEELLPWKHWSKAKMGEKAHPECTQEERLNHLRLELIDQIHFIVEALIFTGLTAEDVYQLYLKKNLVNIERQEKAYNCAKKTEEDNNVIAQTFIS